MIRTDYMQGNAFLTLAYLSVSLATAIGQIIDTYYSNALGHCSFITQTSEGWYIVEGLIEPNNVMTGIIVASNAANTVYAFRRDTGADAVLKKLGDGAESITITFSSSWNFSNDTSRSEPYGGGSCSHVIDTTGWNTLTVVSNSGCTISATGDISNIDSVTIKGSGSKGGGYSSGSATYKCVITLSV